MKRLTSFLFILLLTTSFCARSQTVLSGSIEDENGKQLSGATIMISRDSTAAILTYGISGSNGKFEVKVDSPADSLFFKVSYIGYRTWTRFVQNRNQQLHVRLLPSSEELKEVHVESRMIEQRGDTLSFSVSAFKDKSDRVIADVLKKMPGIEIMPGGEIHYQGQPIQKYYIEGLDLLEGRYSLANNNISADDVSKVQILENHQPVKVLDSLEFSERASLNIKLKNEVTTSGTAEVGAGFSPLLRQIKLTPMLFTKKRQAIVTYQSNNTGSDVSREIRDFSFDDFDENFSIQKTDWLSIQRLSEPPFSSERWLDNDVHLGSVNFLHRIKKDMDLKVNVSYLNDTQRQQGSTRTRFFTPADTVDVLENIYNELFLNTLQSKLTLEKNTSENYLKNQLEINGFWNSELGLVARPDTEIAQRLNNPFSAARNKLRMLRTVGKQLVTLRSNTGFTRAKQHLKVNPGQFPEILNSRRPYSETGQFLEATNFFSDNSAGFTKAIRNFTLSPKLGFSIQKEQLNSNLITEAGERGTDFKNRLEYLSSQVYLENTLRFQDKNKTWNIRLATPLSLNNFNLRDANFSEDRNLTRLAFEPTLYIKRQLTPFWETTISAGIHYNFGDIQQLYKGFLLTSYRNLQRYNAPIAEQLIQQASGRFSYRNPLEQIFINASYTFNRQKNNLLYSNLITTNGARLLEAVEQDNFSRNHSVSLSGSKYFSRINTNLKLSANYRVSDRDQMLNGTLTAVQNNSLNLGGSLSSEISAWLSLNYDLKFSHFQTAFENRLLQKIETNQQILGIFVYPQDDQYLHLAGEYYRNSLSDNGGNFFANLTYQYTLKNPKLDLSITWNNILNTEEFVNAYSNEFSYVENRYMLRPSQLLAGIKFSF